MAKNKNTPYAITHIGTKRYTTRKTGGIAKRRGGNYESLASFKNLPQYNELEKSGRSWEALINYKPVVDRIVIDVDSEDLDKALQVTKEIMQETEEYKEYANIYFSGSKGFHIAWITEELDIIDTTVEKPKDSCPLYRNFLNYFHNKYPEVDTKIKDIGTRIFRKHHTKHEKTGNYKILIDIDNADLKEIKKQSRKNKDIVDKKDSYLPKADALNLLQKYSKEDDKETKSTKKDVNLTTENKDDIFIKVFNEMNGGRHDRIGLLGAGLNGYVTEEELREIYRILDKNTDIGGSDNAEQSLIDAYNNDDDEYNLGQLYNHFKENDKRMEIFNALSDYLEAKRNTTNYEKFQEYKNKHNNDWFEMLETELYDYEDNTENIFKGIIHSVMALFGYGSRIMVVNGGSEVGKSKYIKTLENLMPNVENLGSSTPASVRRREKEYFDKKIIYLGDKGLRGDTQQSREEFIGLYEVFGGLVTEKEFKRDIVSGEKVLEFNLKSDGLCVLYTEPYTDINKWKVGEQYKTRSTFITINEVDDTYTVCEDYVFNEDEEIPFYQTHNEYISYILKNPLKLQLKDKKYIRRVHNDCNGSIRTFKYLWGLLKAYCQYLQIEKPTEEQVQDFLNTFNTKQDITDIEYLVYEKLYNNLKVIKDETKLKCYLTDGDEVYLHKHLLKQRRNRNEKPFFTTKQIQIYFKEDFKQNKNLKDTIDSISEILKNLYNAGFIEQIDYKFDGQNVYYIPYNAEMEN